METAYLEASRVSWWRRYWMGLLVLVVGIVVGVMLSATLAYALQFVPTGDADALAISFEQRVGSQLDDVRSMDVESRSRTPSDMMSGGTAPDRQDRPEATTGTQVEVLLQASGEMHPISFVWKGRMLRIIGWSRSWKAEGNHYFLVMTGDNRIWELRFTGATQQWHIEPKSEVRPSV